MVRDIFSSKLRDVRTQKGINLSDLAKMTGLCEQSLRRYENGKSLPRANTLFKLVKALDTDVKTLLGVNLIIELLNEEATVQQSRDKCLSDC